MMRRRNQLALLPAAENTAPSISRSAMRASTPIITLKHNPEPLVAIGKRLSNPVVKVFTGVPQNFQSSRQQTKRGKQERSKGLSAIYGKVISMRLEQRKTMEKDINDCLSIRSALTPSLRRRSIRVNSVGASPQRCATAISAPRSPATCTRNIRTPSFSTKKYTPRDSLRKALRTAQSKRESKFYNTCGPMLNLGQDPTTLGDWFMNDTIKKAQEQEVLRSQKATPQFFRDSYTPQNQFRVKNKGLVDFIKDNERSAKSPTAKTVVVDLLRKSFPKSRIEKVIIKRFDNKNLKKKLLIEKGISSFEEWKKRYELWSRKFTEIRIVRNDMQKLIMNDVI